MSAIILPDNLVSRYVMKKVKNFRINGTDSQPSSGGIDFKAVAKYLNRLAIIKPFSEGKEHIKMVISTSKDFQNILSTISTSDATVRSYFKLFLASNDETTCGWTDFTDEQGIGPQFNEKPIYFNIVDYLTEMVNYEFTPDSILYVKYYWWHLSPDDGREVSSDWYSLVFPSMSEVGANSTETALKRDIQKLRDEITQSINYTELVDGYWELKPGMNIIEDELPTDDDHPRFLLKDYSDEKVYKVKFGIAKKPEDWPEEKCIIELNKEEFGGAVELDDNGEKEFDWDSKYYVIINMGSVIIHPAVDFDYSGEIDALGTRLDTVESELQAGDVGLSRDILEKAQQLYSELVTNYSVNYPHGIGLEDMRDSFGQFLSSIIHRS